MEELSYEEMWTVKSKSFDTGWALLALAFLALLIMLPGLAAYGEGDQARSVTLTPLSIAATAVAGITLVPYTRTGFSSVVPNGWTEKNSGEFWRGSPETDPTVVVQQDVPGATTDMVLELLRPKLGREKLPKSVGVNKKANCCPGICMPLSEKTRTRERWRET